MDSILVFDDFKHCFRELDTSNYNDDLCIFHLSSVSFPEIQSTQIRYFRAGISAL